MNSRRRISALQRFVGKPIAAAVPRERVASGLLQCMTLEWSITWASQVGPDPLLVEPDRITSSAVAHFRDGEAKNLGSLEVDHPDYGDLLVGRCYHYFASSTGNSTSTSQPRFGLATGA